jgi:hypothetical protein
VRIGLEALLRGRWRPVIIRALALGVWALLVMTIAGVPAVRAQLLRLPSLVPGRAGTGSFLWFDRAFPDLDVFVTGGTDFETHRVRVSVSVSFHDERWGRCYVIPDDLRVAVNGHLLEISERGHENTRRSWLPCTPAWFGSRKGDVIETDRPLTVTLDQGSKHAEMLSASFFQPRQRVLRSGSTARIGDIVIVDRRPRDQDLLEGTPMVRLEKSTSSWQSVELFPQDGVKYAAGTWRFALPRLAPGRYKVSAGISGMNFAVVDTCHGVHRCSAEIPSSTYLAAPELDVVE